MLTANGFAEVGGHVNEVLNEFVKLHLGQVLSKHAHVTLEGKANAHRSFVLKYFAQRRVEHSTVRKRDQVN